MKYEMKPLFKERMSSLLPNKEDFEAFEKIVHTSPPNYIRCNTLKISPSALYNRLSKKWKIKKISEKFPEILLVEENLKPGELGNAIEHVLGYYYIQELSSMLSVFALSPKPNELVLDLCASPGSKTSQIASSMENKGTIIANDLNLGRIRILASTLERCGVTNCIVTRNDAINLCSKMAKNNIKADKILLDAPCSGEGTLRSSPKTFLIWNINVVEKLSRMQKKMIAYALKCLKKNGVLVYSTCTHSPEENESVIQFALNNFPVKIEKIELPVKSRQGLSSWQGENYSQELKKACRIYPQDNDSEGFFLCKMTLREDVNEKSENRSI